jgi:Spy/CpxP family protein refolding chaperone
MKRMFFSGVVAAVIGVSAFGFSYAQGRGPRGGDGPGFAPGFGGRGPGGLARLADLTEEQQKLVRSILEEDRASRQGPPAAVTLQRQLSAELLADAPDDQKIDTLRQQLIQAQGEELARHIALERKIAQVLTPEQRATARQRLAEGPRGRGERGQGRFLKPLGI